MPVLFDSGPQHYSLITFLNGVAQGAHELILRKGLTCHLACILRRYTDPLLSMMHVAGSRSSMLLLLNSCAHKPMTGKTTAQ